MLRIAFCVPTDSFCFFLDMQMVKFIPSLMIPLLLVSSLGCQIGIKGSGVAKTETRQLADFKSISNEAVGDVIVTIGDTQSVEVTIDDNLMPLLVTEVENGVLKIKTTGSFSTSLGLNVKVTVPSLESLRSSGVGNTKIEGLKSIAFPLFCLESVAYPQKAKSRL